MHSASSNNSGSGVSLIQSEMQRQHADALASLDAVAEMAGRVAASIRRTGRLALIGMGGSHCMNRIAEALYRDLRVETLAITASEQLYQAMPGLERWTRILTSQSGGSAEIIRMLGDKNDDTFGLTLNAESNLANSLPCLIGVGGPEIAYAATRSLLVTLALHSAVLQALGAPQADVRAILGNPPSCDISSALVPLAEVSSVIFTARSSLVGVAEAGALGLLELAQIPGFALEGGQFRHGPIEALKPEIGVVMFRADDDCAHLSDGLAAICLSADVTPIVFDASGLEPIAGCVTVSLPRLSGLAAVIASLPALQTMLLELAQTRVENVGVPVRAKKVTDAE